MTVQDLSLHQGVILYDSLVYIVLDTVTQINLIQPVTLVERLRVTQTESLTSEYRSPGSSRVPLILCRKLEGTVWCCRIEKSCTFPPLCRFTRCPRLRWLSLPAPPSKNRETKVSRPGSRIDSLVPTANTCRFSTIHSLSQKCSFLSPISSEDF